jgi:prepilin-type N-terminal cleavage/methylation domain-containing protein
MPNARLRCPSPAFAANPGGQWRAQGVTLVELVVTLAVFAILVGIAAPSFVQMMAANRMATQTNELVAALGAAKSEAVRRGHSVTLRALDNANPNDFHRGWQTITDENGDGVAASATNPVDGTLLYDTQPISGTTTIIRSTRAGTAPSFTYPAATSSLANRQLITFNARGGLIAASPAYFRICDPSSTGIRGRIVQVSMIGRISLDSTNEDCSS